MRLPRTPVNKPGVGNSARRGTLEGCYILFTCLWWWSLLPFGYRPLLLLDDQFPDVQPSDLLELLYVQALDPAALHGERPDRQSAYRHCSRSARAERQSAEARPPQPRGHPRERHLRPERTLLRPPCSAHLVHRPLLPDPLGGNPRGRPFQHKHDAINRSSM